MNYNEFNALKQNITQFSYQTKLYLSFEFLSSCNQRIIVHVPISHRSNQTSIRASQTKQTAVIFGRWKTAKTQTVTDNFDVA